MSKLAIITGSSGGIGQALVEKYIDDDYVVIGFDIKATKGLKTDSLKTISTDLYQFSVDLVSCYNYFLTLKTHFLMLLLYLSH